MTVREISIVNAMEYDERVYMRVSINNAWMKLNEYYTHLGSHHSSPKPWLAIP